MDPREKGAPPSRIPLGALASLLIASAALRLPFWADRLFHLDSHGYALCTGCPGPAVAHPPGFIGYCTLTSITHCLTGHRIFSLILVSFLSTMGSIVLCWMLARRVGMNWKRASLVTAAYSLSLNTLYYSTVGLSYAAEGFFATAVGLLALRTLQDRTWKDAVALTLVWAVGGAVRPTTTVFLAPLWFFCCAHVRPRWKTLALGGVLASALISTWTYGNRHYLGRKGAVSDAASSFEFQAGLAGAYDPGTLFKVVPGPYGEGNEGMGYHWPFVETAVFIDDHLGTRLFPHREKWAEPSLRHALRITVYQLLKVAFYTVVSAPVLLLLFPLVLSHILSRRAFDPEGTASEAPFRRAGDWMKVIFFALWIGPAALFFAVGHFGSFGYLQVFLAGLMVACYQGMWAWIDRAGVSPRVARASRALAVVLPLCGGAFFLSARPLESQSDAAIAATVALFQYSGPSIRMHFNVSRADLIDERMLGHKQWWRTELPNMTFEE